MGRETSYLSLIFKRFFRSTAPYQSVSRRPIAGKERGPGCAPGDHESTRTKDGEFHMSKILSTAILAGLMFGLAAPIVEAKSAPKTKADCEKIATMKWDDATKACVKK
jgi:hypothetical protein